MAWLAAVTSGLFVSLAALHGYWATGGVWPGHDASSLADLVFGARTQKTSAMPSAAACATVAGLLAASALLVSSAAGIIFALPLAHLGASVVSLVLLLRGVLGFFDRWLRPSTRGSRFARLNLMIYSPLCLGLSALTYVSTR